MPTKIASPCELAFFSIYFVLLVSLITLNYNIHLV